jgi:tellurite resistance protein
MPLGIIGLSGAWQRLVPLGHTIGNPLSLYLFGAGLFLLALLTLLWLARLMLHFDVVRQEIGHPVQGALLAQWPVSLLLVTALIAPIFPQPAEVWWAITLAALLVAGLLAWPLVARPSSGQMSPGLVTPALFMPTVLGGFVGSMALGAIEQPGWAALLFGMGAGGWALLEIRIVPRLFSDPLPADMRPTLDMEIAPAAVGSLALATLWPALPVDALVICLGVTCVLLLAVLTRWRDWAAAPFTAGFWSFAFPLAAMAGATVEAVRRGGWPSQVGLAAVLIASTLIGFLALRTLVLLARGRRLPPQ